VTLDTCPSCGCLLKQPSQRSGAQNRYWHGVIIPILAAHFGYNHEECHAAIRDHFLGRDDLGTGLRVPGSTKKLSVQAFSLLIDEVRVWAHVEHNCVIPAPNEHEEEAA
jgi:hypothetical protein